MCYGGDAVVKSAKKLTAGLLVLLLALSVFLPHLPVIGLRQAAAAAPGAPVILSDFDSGAGGWTAGSAGGVTGSLTVDSAVYHDGSAAGKFVSDFSQSGTYTVFDKTLDTPLHVQKLDLWVKTSDFTAISVRLLDSSGESHQQRILLADTSDWQQVSVTNLTGTTVWGGDNNKVFNPPLKMVTFTFDKTRLKSGLVAGNVWIDSITADVRQELSDNGGFEAGRWAETTLGAALINGTAHSGNMSLQVSGGAAEQYTATAAAVDPLKNYELGLWMKKNVSTASGIYVKVQELDKYGQKVPGTLRSLLAADGTQDWTRSTVGLGSLSPTTAFVKLSFGLNKSVTGNVYFDDIALTSQPESVTLNLNGAGAVLDPKTASFDMQFYVDSPPAPLTYTIEYDVPDSGVVFPPYSVAVLPNSMRNVSLPLTGLKNGVYSLNVNVMDGERLVRSYSKPFSIMPAYVKQFGDEDSLIGASTHYALENRQGPTDTELIDRAGIRFVRDELNWHKTEKQLGVFDFSRHDGWVNDMVSRGIRVIGVLDFANTLYNGKANDPNGVKYAFQTKAELDAYVRYVSKTVEHYKGKIDMFEIWNEPNIPNFWKPETNSIDYATMVKAAAAAIREANPDAYIIAGALGDQNDTGFLTDLFEHGAYPYIDAVSYHPYIYPYSPDGRYGNKPELMAGITASYGGWKDMIVTEFGWPTSQGSRGVSEPLQAEYLVKSYMISAAVGIKRSAVYDFRDDGTDLSYTEHNFGIVHDDFTAKPALIAMRQMNEATAGSQFAFQLDLAPGAQGYLWLKNNMPVLVAWSTQGEQTVDFGAETVAAADIYGNPLVSDSHQVSLGAKPAYISGLSSSWLRTQIFQNLTKQYDAWLELWMAELQNATGVREQVAALRQYAGTAATDGNSPDYGMLVQMLNSHYAQGAALLQRANGQPAAELTKTMAMLHDFFDAGSGWDKLLSIASDLPQAPGVLGSGADIEAASGLIASRLAPPSTGSLKFAQELLSHAKRWNAKAEAYRDQGLAYGAIPWDFVASKLADWAEAAAGFETVERTDILLQLFPSKISVFQSQYATIQANITNLANIPFSGSVSFYSADGAPVGQTIPVSPGAKESQAVNLTLAADDPLLEGTDHVFVRLLADGAIVREEQVPLKILSRADVSLVPSAEAFSNLNEVRVKVKNKMPVPLSGTVSVEAPEGWQLSQTELPFSLTASGEQELSFPVAQKMPAAYHDYSFRLVTRDGQGQTMDDKKVPLSFTVIRKVLQPIDPAAFTGETSAWQDAYPLYLNPPEDPESESLWQSSNSAAKAFFQWDEDNLYLLVRAYDDMHNNPRLDSQIWNGDSIQLSIDAANDKTSAYNGDDYEYGFALTGAGNQAYAWKAATGKPAGPKPAGWVNVVRSEAQHTTSYMIRLPRAEVEPLSLAELSQVGLNIVLNDADVLDRDRFYEFTGGTASSKNPGLYRTFKLLNTPKSGTVLQVEAASGIYSDPVALKAALKDSLSRPVAGETVSFIINGLDIGTAVTDAQGMATLSYKINVEAAPDASTMDYEVKAVFVPQAASLYLGSEGTGTLKVGKEEASIALSSLAVGFANVPVALSATVQQQQDGEPGSLEGLPISFSFFAVSPTVTGNVYDSLVTEAVCQTDSKGIASANLVLPAGLYEVKSNLLSSGKFTAAHSAPSLLVVYDPLAGEFRADGWIDFDPQTDVAGMKDKKMRMEAKLGYNHSGAPIGKFELLAQPQGIELESESLDWLIIAENSAYVQGKAADKDGKPFTVRLMFEVEAIGPISNPIVSVLVWRGDNTTEDPVYESVDQKLHDDISFLK